MTPTNRDSYREAGVHNMAGSVNASHSSVDHFVETPSRFSRGDSIVIVVPKIGLYSHPIIFIGVYEFILQ
jgi:hypothetical protein